MGMAPINIGEPGAEQAMIGVRYSPVVQWWDFGGWFLTAECDGHS
jgi:hypothetical protein